MGTTVAMIACAVIALFAIIILYLTRSNIIDLLDRDVVMYDKNYQLKKDALEEAFNCLDLIAQNGVEIKNNPQFITRAKEAYNGLLCTVSNPKIYQEFYAKALDISISGYSVDDIEKFKITCRAEIVGTHKSKGEGFKGMVSGMSAGQQGSRLIQPNPQARPMQPNQRPQARPMQGPKVRPQNPTDGE